LICIRLDRPIRQRRTELAIALSYRVYLSKIPTNIDVRRNVDPLSFASRYLL
jgi:hypothetical protein